MLENAIAAFIGYLFGSIPTGYLVVRRAVRRDPRYEDRCAVGTENTLRLTGSPFLALIVLVVDVFKGIMGMYVAQYVLSLMGYGIVLVGFPFVKPVALPVYIAGVFAVVGHCFPVWLGFRGGRGLATSFGVMIALEPSLVLLWLLAFGLGILFSVLFAGGVRSVPTIFSCAVSPVVAYLLGYQGWDYYTFLALCVVIVLSLNREIRLVLEGKMDKMFFLQKKEKMPRELEEITTAVVAGKDEVDFEDSKKRVVVPKAVEKKADKKTKTLRRTSASKTEDKKESASKGETSEKKKETAKKKSKGETTKKKTQKKAQKKATKKSTKKKE